MIKIKKMKGKAFNKKYKHVNLYKFLPENHIIKDYEFKEGLNVDVLSFFPDSNAPPGDFHFCEESKCYLFWKEHGKCIAFIKIPDNATVFIDKENIKFKSNKITITNIINFSTIDNKFWVDMFQKDYRAFEFIHYENQTKGMCILAVQYNGNMIRFVKPEYQTEDMCILAIRKKWFKFTFCCKPNT